MIDNITEALANSWAVYAAAVAGLMLLMILVESLAWAERVRAIPDGKIRRRLLTAGSAAPLVLTGLLTAGRAIHGAGQPWVVGFVAGGLSMGLIVAAARLAIVDIVYRGWREGFTLRAREVPRRSAAVAFVDLIIAFTLVWSEGVALLYVIGARV